MISAARTISIVALAARIVSAQDVTTKVDEWAIGTELGLNAARGNSSYTMMTGGLRFTHLNKKQFELDWTNGITYGQSDVKVIARRLVTTLKADYKPQSTWSPFVFASAERDVIRRERLLSNAGAGAKWTFFRNQPGSASLSLAGIYTVKTLVPATTPAIPGSEPRPYTTRLSLRPRLVQRATSGLSFEQTTFWQPVYNAIDDYAVESSTRVGYAVSKTSTLFIQHSYRYDSRPPTTIKREDQLLVAGVKVQF